MNEAKAQEQLSNQEKLAKVDALKKHPFFNIAILVECQRYTYEGEIASYLLDHKRKIKVLEVLRVLQSLSNNEQTDSDLIKHFDEIFAEENILDWIPISSRFFKLPTDEIFLLKIKGNSMSPKIEDGDVVIVRKQYTAELGDTIVALLEDGTTVKKYIPHEDHIVLQPVNPEFEPIVVFPDEIRIQGIVKGVLKYY